jgi:hypothetical protein
MTAPSITPAIQLYHYHSVIWLNQLPVLVKPSVHIFLYAYFRWCKNQNHKEVSSSPRMFLYVYKPCRRFALFIVKWEGYWPIALRGSSQHQGCYFFLCWFFLCNLYSKWTIIFSFWKWFHLYEMRLFWMLKSNIICDIHWYFKHWILFIKCRCHITFNPRSCCIMISQF